MTYQFPIPFVNLQKHFLGSQDLLRTSGPGFFIFCFFFTTYLKTLFLYPHKNPYHLKPDTRITWLIFLANQLFSADPRKKTFNGSLNKGTRQRSAIDMNGAVTPLTFKPQVVKFGRGEVYCPALSEFVMFSVLLGCTLSARLCACSRNKSFSTLNSLVSNLIFASNRSFSSLS